jgi:hypothetical protein
MPRRFFERALRRALGPVTLISSLATIPSRATAQAPPAIVDSIVCTAMERHRVPGAVVDAQTPFGLVVFVVLPLALTLTGIWELQYGVPPGVRVALVVRHAARPRESARVKPSADAESRIPGVLR